MPTNEGRRISLSRMKRRGIPTLGERITSLMVASGLNTSELSARTDISVSYLSRIIQGEVVNPTIDFVMRIAAGLGVTESELLREDEEDKHAGAEKRPNQKVVGQGQVVRSGSQASPKSTHNIAQNAAAPSTAYHSPLSISSQKVLKHRLAVLEKKLEAAEKNLHEAHEELREIGTLEGKEQQLSFAERLYLQVAGPAIEVRSFFDEIEAGNLPEFKVAIAPRESTSIFARHTQGYEARLYGVVEFMAHATEKLAHDYVKRLIETRFPQSSIEVKISQDVEKK
jgi:transcriptional regulator with XRE-family HTH domain